MPRGEKPRYIEPAPPYPKKTKCAMRRNKNGSVYKICYKSDTGNPPPKTKSAPKKAEEKKPAPKKPEPKKAEPKKEEKKQPKLREPFVEKKIPKEERKEEKEEKKEEKKEKKDGGEFQKRFTSLEDAKKFSEKKNGEIETRISFLDYGKEGRVPNMNVHKFLQLLSKKEKARGRKDGYPKKTPTSVRLKNDIIDVGNELFPEANIFVKQRDDKKKTREIIDKLIKARNYNIYKVLYKG